MLSLAKEVQEKALNLPTSEREHLANLLFQSVHNQSLNELEEEWLAVAVERYEAMSTGADKGIEEEAFFKSFGMR